MYAAGTILKVHYECRLEDGSIVSSTRLQGNVPLEFQVGKGEMLPALEAHIVTMGEGERASFLIPAAQAYGAYDDTLKERVPVEDIPHGLDLPLGGYVTFSTARGPLRVKVESIEDGMVTFDCNHQLAGCDLAFTVEVVAALDMGDHLQHERFYASKHHHHHA